MVDDTGDFLVEKALDFTLLVWLTIPCSHLLLLPVKGSPGPVKEYDYTIEHELLEIYPLNTRMMDHMWPLNYTTPPPTFYATYCILYIVLIIGLFVKVRNMFNIHISVHTNNHLHLI